MHLKKDILKSCKIWRCSLRTPGKLIWRKRPEVDASGFVTRICTFVGRRIHIITTREWSSATGDRGETRRDRGAMGRVYVLYFDHNECDDTWSGKRVTVMEFSKRNPNWLFVGLRDGRAVFLHEIQKTVRDASRISSVQHRSSENVHVRHDFM